MSPIESRPGHKPRFGVDAVHRAWPTIASMQSLSRTSSVWTQNGKWNCSFLSLLRHFDISRGSPRSKTNKSTSSVASRGIGGAAGVIVVRVLQRTRPRAERRSCSTTFCLLATRFMRPPQDLSIFLYWLKPVAADVGLNDGNVLFIIPLLLSHARASPNTQKPVCHPHKLIAQSTKNQRARTAHGVFKKKSKKLTAVSFSCHTV